MADQIQPNEKNGKRPEEHEAAQKPPCILDTGNGELLGVAVPIEASFREGAMPLARSVHFLRRNLWCLPIIVLGEPVRSVLE